MSEEIEELSLRDQLETAMEEHTAEPVVTESKPEVTAETKPAAEGRDEQGKFVAKPKDEPTAQPVPTAKKVPLAWAKNPQFNALTPEMQDAIIERETEVEKGFTRLDDDRNFGKSLKEVIAPYMATITAEGGTPAGAVKDLMNTAYVLRSGTEQQKVAVVQQVIKQYGINPQLLGIQQTQQQQTAPQAQPINEEAITQKIMNNLQTQQMNANIAEELKAFTADPKNVHFSNTAVKGKMSSLLGTGEAKNYQDAYDQAIWLVPELRPALIAAQTQPNTAQRTQDIAAKKKAGSSVSGSPGIVVPNSGNPNRSLREELEANMSAAVN